MDFRFEGLSWMGRTHVQNHDSYLFGTTDYGLCWAVVSDGCSSSKNAAQGSKDMVRVVQEILESSQAPITDARQFEYLIVKKLDELGLVEPIDYAATAVVLQIYEGQAYVFFFGDGSLLVQNCNGLYKEIAPHYSRNAPRFLHYFVKNSRGVAYCDEMSGPAWAHGMYPPQALSVTTLEFGDTVVKARTAAAPLGSPYTVVLDLKADDVWNLMICSDGVTDPSASMRDAIIKSDLAEGLVQHLGALKLLPSFVMPRDDSTFVNVRVVG